MFNFKNMNLNSKSKPFI